MKNDKGGEGLVSMREMGTPSVHKLGERDGSGNDEGDQNIHGTLLDSLSNTFGRLTKNLSPKKKTRSLVLVIWSRKWVA